MIKTINKDVVYSIKDITDILDVHKYKMKNLIKECGVDPISNENRTNYYDSESLIPIIEYWMIKLKFKFLKEKMTENKND